MSDQTWGDSFKGGTLDGMRIYQEILSTEQMATLMEQTEAAYADVIGSRTTPLTTNLLTLRR